MDDFQKNRKRVSRADSLVILEDFGDRLNSLYTPLVILLLAGVTMANAYFLRPVSCNIPTTPANDFTGFADSLCWSEGAIGIHDDGKTPPNEWEKIRRKSELCELN